MLSLDQALQPSAGNDSADLPLDTYVHDLKEEILYVAPRPYCWALIRFYFRYMFHRLPEGGQGVIGFDDGEGDD